MSQTPRPRLPKHLAQLPTLRRFDSQTLSMIVALASEVTVLRARQDTLERLLAERNVLEPEAIEQYDPDPAAQEKRNELRQQSMRKIFRALIETGEADLASLGASAPKEKTA